GRRSLALNYPARDVSSSRLLRVVIDGEPKEVLAFAAFWSDDGRAQDHSISLPDDDGAVGLFGQSAGFDGKHATRREFDLLGNGFRLVIRFLHLVFQSPKSTLVRLPPLHQLGRSACDS